MFNPASFMDTAVTARVMRDAVTRQQTRTREVEADPDWKLPPARLARFSYCEKGPYGHVSVAGHDGRAMCQRCLMPLQEQ